MALIGQPCWNSPPWIEPAQWRPQGLCLSGFLEETSLTSIWLCEPSRDLELSVGSVEATPPSLCSLRLSPSLKTQSYVMIHTAL